MNFLPDIIQNYSEKYSDSEPLLLQQLARETYLKVMYPRMLSGHLQGRFLSMISKLIAPTLIVEVGTYTGYSALCFAEGLAAKGKIITCELDPEIAHFAQNYFDKSEYKSQIYIRVGDAIEIIPTINQTIDLAFLDGEKEQYLNYYELLFPKMRKGGVIIADNVLWSGSVADPNKNDSTTKAIRMFNDYVTQDNRVTNILLPFRDGIQLIIKKGE